MEKIRAAVIGCGNISVMHSDSIAALDEAELVAVCDVKKERAEAAAKIYIETVKKQPQRIVSYTGGKSYWGTQHAVQIDQFYRAAAGLEPLQISGREALKIQKIISDIYNNNDTRDWYVGCL